MFLFPLGGVGTSVVILRNDGTSASKPLPGQPAFLGDDEQFVMWSEGEQMDAFRFANGSIVKRGDLLQPDYSGKYFFQAAGRTTHVARCSAPEDVLMVSDLNGKKLFRREGSLYLCGEKGTTNEWACDVYQETDARLAKRNRIELGPYPTLDLDPFSGRLLVVRVRDDPFTSEWFVVSPDTGTKEPVGSGADFGLFLAREIRPPH